MSGSESVGPSKDYLALLRGEIEPDEYVRRLKATVDARLSRGSRRSLASPLTLPAVVLVGGRRR